MENLGAANNSLNTALEAIDAEVKKLDEKEKSLLARSRKLDEDKLEIARINGDADVSGDDRVKINAGGKVIAVMRSTLTQFKGTRLEALFSGRWDKKLVKDSSGHIFLDVNPVCFQAIIDYLNDVRISNDESPAAPPSVDLEYKEILMHQLELFGLSDGAFLIELPDSHIIKELDRVKIIHEWLEDDGSDGELTLLYRSSSDGRDDATFHSKCDHKGPTLTIIETTEGHIIGGGYSDVDWAHNGGWQQSSKAFLYAFSKADDFAASKMKLKAPNDPNGIYCDPSCGPTFGYPNDLYVRDEELYIHMDYTYSSPPSQLAGERYFTIEEMEVFQIIPRSSGTPRPKTEKKKTKKNCMAAANSPTCFSSSINSAIENKQVTLAEAESEIAAMEVSFKNENKFIKAVSGQNNQEVICLDVCGTPMATTKQTLGLHGDSSFASKILDQKQNCNNSNPRPVKEWNTDDVVAWLNSIDGISSSIVKNFEEDEVSGRELLAFGKEGLMDFGVTKKGTIIYLLSEIEKLNRSQGEALITVEHSPYCFEKIIDHLRLESMFIRELIQNKPGLPVVKVSEKSRFEHIVKYYFPGEMSKSLLGN